MGLFFFLKFRKITKDETKVVILHQPHYVNLFYHSKLFMLLSEYIILYINKLLGCVFNFLFSWAGFFFWLQDGDNIWVLDLWSVQSALVVRFENLDFDSQNTLSEEDVSDGGVNVSKTFGWETGVDHHTVGEFHTLGSLSSDFTGDDDFTTSSALFHDESENTVGGSSDSKTSQEFVSERFGLSDSGETSVGNSFDVQVDLTLFVSPSFVNDSGQFPDSSGFFSQNLTWSGSDDDNFASFRFSDNNSRVSILSQFSFEEFVQFSFEKTVSDEEVFFRDWPSGRLSLCSHY